MKYSSLWKQYYEWLLDKIGLDERRKMYRRVLLLLHHKEFVAVLDMDQNRIEDGLYLRNIFKEDAKNDNIGVLNENPCSVLEVLVALAIRIDEEYLGDPNHPHPEIIFWEMFTNLGLDDFFNQDYDKEDVDYILENWMYRNYESNGDGSPFPLRQSEGDVRELEIWDHMQHYLFENYYE